MNVSEHDHGHAPNRFAVIPTPSRLDADTNYTGKGVTIAFLDSGFYPHPDLVNPSDRILAYHDLASERPELSAADPSVSWQWHGTQTSVAAAGSGHLCEGIYRGLAHDAKLVLVKVSERGHITEENIARGFRWIRENRDRYGIRVINISLGGDEDVPCSQSIIDQEAEAAVAQGIVVVVAAGNSGGDGSHSIPPANAPSVITVGGYHDNNQVGNQDLDLYHSNYGVTADGTVKPEVVAPARWVAAPILPGTDNYARAEALSKLAAATDYQLPALVQELGELIKLPASRGQMDTAELRDLVESTLADEKIVAAHYQHVDGTSFAAPIVTSIIAQMIEANPNLTPGAVKSILLSTADRIAGAPALRQGYGVVNARRAVELAKTEQHGLNISGCNPPRVANGRIVFLLHDDRAKSVGLAGDFNQWVATPLTQGADKLWRAEIEAPAAGRYEYKLVVDGHRWIEDPSNGFKTSDNFGGLNSVLVIE